MIIEMMMMMMMMMMTMMMVVMMKRSKRIHRYIGNGNLHTFCSDLEKTQRQNMKAFNQHLDVLEDPIRITQVLIK